MQYGSGGAYDFAKEAILEDADFKTSPMCPPIYIKDMPCVSVAIKNGVVGVRDTKDPTKTTLLFNSEEWRVFVRGVKSGEFDV